MTVQTDVLPNGLFIKNREKILNYLEPGTAAVLFASHPVPRNGDQYYYPYRAQSDFFYLTGVEQPNCALFLVKKKTDISECMLFIEKNTPKSIAWEGLKLTREEAMSRSGISSVRYIEELDTTLKDILPSVTMLHMNIRSLDTDPVSIMTRDEVFYSQLHCKYPELTFHSLKNILLQARCKKEPEEIEIIKKAVKITNDAFMNILPKIGPGIGERDIEVEIDAYFKKSGAAAHAYAPIVAGGKNACVLHYTQNNATLQHNDLLLLDFGAEFHNYASDITRTIPVSGRFSARQRQLYNATLEVLKFALSIIKPGTTINQIQEQVVLAWQEQHLKLGLYSVVELEASNTNNPLWKNYYMHTISHFMGLDVHDVGTKDTVLEPGMVLTVEPGIYIREENTGIRLEDDVLVTPDGIQNLSQDIIIHPDEIEAQLVI
jgi:Xaa-Pro aminopeptidase